MAEPKTDESAKQTDADTSGDVKPAAKAEAQKPAARKTAASKAPAKKAPVKKVPVKKAVAKKATAAKKPAPARKPVAASNKVAKPRPAKAPLAEQPSVKPTVTELKEKIMATTPEFNSEMTETMTEAVNEMQDRFQAAYEKSQLMFSEMTELAKGNVEAFVESGKILAGGMQDMGKTYTDEAKTVYETATADMKEMAAVKSPTELFQLQGKIMRRNFDAMVAIASKNTDTAMKLANDSVAPITGRVNVAAEKLSNAA